MFYAGAGTLFDFVLFFAQTIRVTGFGGRIFLVSWNVMNDSMGIVMLVLGGFNYLWRLSHKLNKWSNLTCTLFVSQMFRQKQPTVEFGEMLWFIIHPDGTWEMFDVEYVWLSLNKGKLFGQRYKASTHWCDCGRFFHKIRVLPSNTISQSISSVDLPCAFRVGNDTWLDTALKPTRNAENYSNCGMFHYHSSTTRSTLGSFTWRMCPHFSK